MKRVLKLLLLTACGLLVLLALLMTGAFYYLSAPEQIPEREPVPAQGAYRLDRKVGEYHMPEGRDALLTYSAQGGLYLFELNDRRFSAGEYLGRFHPEDGQSFTWRAYDGAFERRVSFQAAPGGRAVSFSWDDGDATSIAIRVREPSVELGEVTFRNAGVTLSGTVFLPPTPGPHPGAVMIHGSGQSSRDNLWYVHIAHHLASNGIAVLLPDKRGTGKSGGEWRTASFQDFAGDALAGVEAMAALPGVDPGRVGLLGISQGGSWVAPLAASQSDRVRFLVNASGSAVTPNEQLRHETAQTLHANGIPAFLDPVLVPYAAAIPKRRRSEWWTKNGDFDPIRYWREADQPVLVLYGAEDEKDNVPVKESLARLERLDRPDLDIRVFEGTGHAFLASDGPRIRSDFLVAMSDWIRHHSLPESPREASTR